MAAPVRYQVSPVNPHEHLFAVEARFSNPGPELRVWMPIWTPGSYLLREFARQVQDFEALDGAGARLAVTRQDKNSWLILGGEAPEVVVRYLVYANELTVRTSHLDGTHGFFNGANLFVTSDAHRAAPCELRLAELPEGWRSFCALPSREGTYLAGDFDELIDSPVEMGPHTAITFQAGGKPHELVVWGQGNLEPERLKRDLARLCEAEVALFGELPCERYLFILHLTDKLRGGLEHAASSTLQFPRFGFRGKSYEELLSLVAHEYFHLWNVKRIKPRALVPFDYGRENYTRLLWAMEGTTSYFDTLMVRRAGLIDADRYLERLGERITTLESTPARRIQTLAEASLLAWVKLYRPDENTPNSGISYYLKGEVVAALLDLQLRAATAGARSLDDLMRLLMSRYGDGSGIPEDGVEAAAIELGGEGLRAFFDRAVRSTEELDYDVLSAVGLVLRRRPRKSAGDKGGTPDGGEEDRGWLGVETRAGDRLVVSTTYSGSPAARAGLYPEDELLALDGFRVTHSSLQERLNERCPGDRVRLTLFRRDQLVEVEATLDSRPRTACYLEKLPSATPDQRAFYEAWLGEPFDQKSK